MKVQYLGDVNDYRKYALLRLLAGAGFKLGIHWLLTCDDDRKDGGNRGYLSQPDTWRSYDPKLFDLLADVPPRPAYDDFRQIELKGIIPRASYFDELVPKGQAARERYHAASMQALAHSDIVFFDPDNGLEVKSVSKARASGVKFVFDDELRDHYQAGRSLLIYQHFPHVERTAFLGSLNARLRVFALDADIWACRTPHVVFMLVANPSRSIAHSSAIAAAIERARAHWNVSFMKFEKMT